MAGTTFYAFVLPSKAYQKTSTATAVQANCTLLHLTAHMAFLFLLRQETQRVPQPPRTVGVTIAAMCATARADNKPDTSAETGRPTGYYSAAPASRFLKWLCSKVKCSATPCCIYTVWSSAMTCYERYLEFAWRVSVESGPARLAVENWREILFFTITHNEERRTNGCGLGASDNIDGVRTSGDWHDFSISLYVILSPPTFLIFNNVIWSRGPPN